MSLARLEAKKNTEVQLKVFAGLDRRDKIADSALSDMLNMSPDAIPALVPREARVKVAAVPGATELCSPEYIGGELSSFTGVMGKSFYYNGTKAEGEPLSEGRKSIADFNGKICIFPDKVYYDYMPDAETGAVKNELVSMEKTLKITGAKFYSSYNEISGEYSAYIQKSDAGFDNSFAVGDSITISGCSVKNNTKQIQSRKEYAAEDEIVSAVVNAVTKSKIDLLLYNRKGEKVKFTNATESGEVTLKIAIPDMDNICVHNNRLWGTAVSGEYIYASKLGDCTNFYSFCGLSDDSWYSYVATGGKFTGICSYRTAVVAFKQNYIHHIYGDAPVNFSIPKQTFSGCCDGRSICEVEGVLYFLSRDGFKAYSGGEPYDISPQLKHKYVSCAAGTNGRYYYAAAKTQDGRVDVLVYAPHADVWVREDDTPFESFCSYNGSLYGIADGEMWRMDGGAERLNWCTVSKRFTYDIAEHKGLNTMWIRADIENGAEINAYISYDGGDFEECGAVSSREGFSVHRIPVRFKKCNSFRIMLEGFGRSVIHDILISTHNGGRNYG